MKKEKRILSIVLAIILTLGCMNLPAYAVDNAKLVLSVKTYDQATGTVGEEVSTAKSGDVVVLSVGLQAGSSAISVVGYQLKVDYDENMVELWKDTTNRTSPFFKKNAIGGDDVSFWGAPTLGTSTTGEISSVITYVESTTDYTELNENVDAGDSIELLQIAFVVKSDAESGNALFSFDDAYDTKVVYYADAASATTTVISPLEETEIATISVQGNPPTLNTIALDKTSIEVDGVNAQTVQAKAASVKGTDITAGVVWSVVPASDDVTVSSTGLVTVAPKAAAGEYTVTAAPGAGTQGSEKTAVLTVTRAASALTSVPVNPTSVTVDGTDGASATATAYDQFGDPISGAAWFVDPAGKGVTAPGGVVSVAADAEVELGVADVLNVYGDPVADPTVSYALKGSYAGVSISGNVITVTSGAAANAFQSGSLSVEVEATVGGLTKSAAVTLTREASVAATVVVNGGSAELEVPAVGAAPAVSAPFTAVVTDQYGTEVSGAEVVWSVTDKTGVSISNAIVSVSDQARDSIAGSAVLTVTAKSGSASGTKTLTVKRAAPVAAQVSVSGGSASILVPADGAAANRSDAFTAVAYDQYGAAISGADITWSVTDNGTPVEGVQIDGGVVTVANAAKAAIADTTGKALTVTAACGGVVSAPASITVKRDVPSAKDVKFFSGSAEVTADTIGIPTSGTAAKTYAAVAYDQYGAEMSAEPALTVSGAVPAGITVTASPSP